VFPSGNRWLSTSVWLPSFFYLAVLIAVLLTYDAAQAFRGPDRNFGIGLGR
jgi:hypothetical protein